MKEIKKKTKYFVLFTLFTIVLTSFVLADSYTLKCISNGQSFDFGATCNPSMSKITTSRTETKSFCVHNQDDGKICPAQPNICNTQNLNCESSGSNTTIDSAPPIANLTSPVDGAIYSSRSMYVTYTTNEPSSVSYLDLLNPRSWLILSRSKTSYSVRRTFKEGQNNLTFKFTDIMGNSVNKTISFFIDSRKPRILKTDPKSGFASGDFDVQIQETNLKSVELTYGNDITGYRTSSININTCQLVKDKYSCSTHVQISDYNNQEIRYWFNVSDIASNNASSRPIKLKVDTLPPVINYLKTNLSRNLFLINLSIDEQNFDSVEYIDSFDSRPSWKTLCSSLSKGSCIKKLTLRNGNHTIQLQINDKAGNSIAPDPIIVKL